MASSHSDSNLSTAPINTTLAGVLVPTMSLLSPGQQREFELIQKRVGRFEQKHGVIKEPTRQRRIKEKEEQQEEEGKENIDQTQSPSQQRTPNRPFTTGSYTAAQLAANVRTPSLYAQERAALQQQQQKQAESPRHVDLYQANAAILPTILSVGPTPLSKRSSEKASSSKRTKASSSKDPINEDDDEGARPSSSASSVKRSIRFAEDEIIPQATNDREEAVSPRPSSATALEDPFASFSPSAVSHSRSSSSASAGMVAASSSQALSAAPSVQISYVTWKLPSSFAKPQPVASATPFIKKPQLQPMQRDVQPSRTQALVMQVPQHRTDPEYVLGVLDDLDPPSNILAVYLDSWLERYLSEPQTYDSMSVFISVKYQELRHLLARLQKPNSFRTWLVCDLLLRLIATLPGQDLGGGVPARTLALNLVRHVLLNIYTKIPAQNFGYLPYQLYARQSLLHVHDRILQRAEGLSRVREFHLHRVKLLQRWQPCIAHAIHAWHVPILALCFQRWKAWRATRLQRGTIVTRIKEQQLDQKCTFLAHFLRYRYRRAVQSTGAIFILNWKLFVGVKHLNTSLNSLSELRDKIAIMKKAYAKATKIQGEREEKLRAVIKNLWETQHQVLELKCRITEEKETHKVHSGQKASTLILTQWFRYLFLRLTSNHQTGFYDGVYTMGWQDTSILLSNLKSQRMRSLFEGFKKQGGDVEAVSSMKSFLKRTNLTEKRTSMRDLAGILSNSGSATPNSTGTDLSKGVSWGTTDLRQSRSGSANSRDQVSMSLNASRRASRRRTGGGMMPNMFEAAFRNAGGMHPAGASNENTTSGPVSYAIAEESTPVATPAVLPSRNTRASLQPVSLDDLSHTTPPLGPVQPRTRSISPASSTTPPTRSNRLTPTKTPPKTPPRTPPFQPQEGPPSSASSKDGHNRRTTLLSNARRTQGISPGHSRTTTSMGSVQGSLHGSRRGSAGSQAGGRSGGGGSSAARQRWRMAILCVIYAHKATPEAEEIRITSLTPGGRKETETMLLNSWMRYQVHHFASIFWGQNGGHGSVVTQAVAENFVHYLVNHTTCSQVAPVRSLDWSQQLAYAFSNEQRALPSTNPMRLIPSVVPPHPPPPISPIMPSLTSNLNLVTQCPIAHPYLALSLHELHLIKVGIAQTLGIGYIATPHDTPHSSSSASKDTTSTETLGDSDYGLLYAVWLRLFSTLPSLPCDFEGEGADELDFDSLFLQLSEAEGGSHLMLHSIGGYLQRSKQLDSFLGLAKSLRFHMKKKRTEMSRSHMVYEKQKRTLQAHIAMRLSGLIKEVEKEQARKDKALAAAPPPAPSSFLQNEAESEKDETVLLSGISTALIARRTSISMALGTGLIQSIHPNMVSSSLTSAIPLIASNTSNNNSHQLVTASRGLSQFNSIAPSALGSHRLHNKGDMSSGSSSSDASFLAPPPHSNIPSAISGHSRNLRVELGQASVDLVAARAAQTLGVPGSSSEPSAPSGSPIIVSRSDPHTRSPGGQGPSSRARSRSNSTVDDKNKNKIEQLAAYASAAMEGEVVEETEEKKEPLPDLDLGPSAVTFAPTEATASETTEPAAAVSTIEAAATVENDGDSESESDDDEGEEDDEVDLSLLSDNTDFSEHPEFIGEGQMVGLDDLLPSSPRDSEYSSKRLVAATAYEVDIIHSLLVQLVKEEAELRFVAMGGVHGHAHGHGHGGSSSSKVSTPPPAGWHVMDQAVDIRRCEILLATHLSQLRKWYRTCLSDEVKARGKQKNKPLGSGSDMLVVTRERVLKLFQRAKLMSTNPGAKAFSNATVAQVWTEIVSWKSEKDGGASSEDGSSANPFASPNGLTFDAALALFCKLSAIRFRSHKFRLHHVSERLNAFLQLCFPLQIVPYTSMASKFYPLQNALSNANTLSTVGAASNKLLKSASTPTPELSSQAAPPPPPMAYLGPQSAFEGDENEETYNRRLCDDVLRAQQKWLSYLFMYYAKEKEVGGAGQAAGAMEPAMSRDNFMEFINESTLLTKKVIYLRTINSIWVSQQASQTAALAAEALLNPGGKPPQSGDSLMTYKYFLESLRVICVFFTREPMIPLPVKLDRLVNFLWLCPGFERCRVSMGVSSAVQNSVASNAAAAAEKKSQAAENAAAAAAAAANPDAQSSGSTKPSAPFNRLQSSMNLTQPTSTTKGKLSTNATSGSLPTSSPSPPLPELNESLADESRAMHGRHSSTNSEATTIDEN